MTLNLPRVLVAIILLAVTVAAQSYCAPQSNGFSCTTDEYIANVTISLPGGPVLLNNPSTCVGSPAYEDFTATVPPLPLAAGVTYSVSVIVGQYWGSDQVGIFLDLNQNFSFEDTGELVVTLTSTASGSGTAPQTLTGTFTVPLTANSGLTRLRARLVYVSFPVPPSCGANTFGNTEDYLVMMNNTVAPEFQVNQPGAAHDIDGVQGGPFGAATVSRCAGSVITVNFNSTTGVGLPWDAALSTVPLLSASQGGFVTAHGQIVNINLTSFLFLNGGLAFPFAPISVPLAVGTPMSLYSQMIIIDPTNADGASLSQPNHLVVNGLTLPLTPFAGPTGDDSQVQVNTGCIAFHGTNFTTMFIESNGRLMFGGGNTMTSPTTTQFASDPASFGCWNDLNPAMGGSITLNSPAPGVIDVAYVNVPYFSYGGANTFHLQLDTNNGIASIVGVNTFAVQSGQLLVGLSGGSAVGTTDPGAVNFSPGGLGAVGFTTNATDMIYAIGQRGTVTTGITRIDFVPNGFGNYDWISQ